MHHTRCSRAPGVQGRVLVATVLAGALVAVLALVAAPATAATPKDTGLLAFVRSNQIYTSTTTGGSVTKLTTSGKELPPALVARRHADRLRARGARGLP